MRDSNEIHKQHEFGMLVDTGASHSYITEQTMRALDLEHKLVTSKTEDGIISMVDTKVLGVLRDVRCRIGSRTKKEFVHVFKVLERGPCPIILGLDLFNKFGCTIDFPNRTVTFRAFDGFSVDFLTKDEIFQYNGCLVPFAT